MSTKQEWIKNMKVTLAQAEAKVASIKRNIEEAEREPEKVVIVPEVKVEPVPVAKVEIKPASKKVIEKPIKKVKR